MASEEGGNPEFNSVSTWYLRRMLAAKCSVVEVQVILAIAIHAGSTRAVHESTLVDDPDLSQAIDANNRPGTIRAAIQSTAEKGLVSAHTTTNGALIVSLADEASGGLEGTSIATDAAEEAQPDRGTTRPTVFALYEQNIGVLTPLLADRINDALSRYPEAWIRDAVAESVYYNRRSWRYIERILENWATEGRGDETHRRNHEKRHDTGASLRDKVAPYLRRR